MLTEVLAPADHALPAGGRRLERPVDGANLEEATFPQIDDRGVSRGPGVSYAAGHQAETPPPEVFAHVTAELLADAEATARLADGEAYAPLADDDRPGVSARAAAVACRFRGGGRLAGDSVALIRVDAHTDSLLVHAFHTFADTRTVVRTQSLFELY